MIDSLAHSLARQVGFSSLLLRQLPLWWSLGVCVVHLSSSYVAVLSDNAANNLLLLLKVLRIPTINAVCVSATLLVKLLYTKKEKIINETERYGGR